jgi:hypothetical protein
MLGRTRVYTYQLIQVPAADGHVALVVIHALAEVTDVSLAGRVLPRAVCGTALPQTVVHRLGLGRGSLLLRLSGSAGATAREEPTDGVADGRTNSYTTTRWSVCASDIDLRGR